MNIFITGGTGFIGTPLVERLAKDRTNKLLVLSRRSQPRQPRVTYLRGDLDDIGRWKGQLMRFKPTVAVHLAWEGIPDYSAPTSIKNLTASLRLLDVLAGAGCKKVICAGSSWEKGFQAPRAEQRPPERTLAFVAAKQALHELGLAMARERNVSFSWARLMFVYGPGQKTSSLIPYLIACAQKNQRPELKNPGAKNDFIYVADVAEALAAIIKKGQPDTTYEIGSGALTTVRDVVRLVFKTYGVPLPAAALKRQPPSASFSGVRADPAVIRGLGWRPKTSLQAGIKKMVDSYASN
ncbi:MAG: hypothetical protein A3J59_03395 [Candidatus Buchananbacteria bacterium RIFCSPHIGHO2_02_FULL_56_16]|uniref:NAD-dependent epimerase/dehydratase domain-containing protein n=1 Tax=Candidatus Buchananbacteria bacterium RIFCSPHIGHO2_02_FULL_56_16 TaxID=1797542 RepID=A0A1G1YIS0_9BACT|nr:MAG: hypothetical protein A3J59_03395 [Candidatus Buchananbacteria bacterium RIFCSPHIGHO2_02_FULL_56_16]